MDPIEQAIDTLSHSARGQFAMRKLLECLEQGWLGLDSSNQDALRLLLEEAWGNHAGTVMESLSHTVGIYR